MKFKFISGDDFSVDAAYYPIHTEEIEIQVSNCGHYVINDFRNDEFKMDIARFASITAAKSFVTALLS